MAQQAQCAYFDFFWQGFQPVFANNCLRRPQHPLAGPDWPMSVGSLKFVSVFRKISSVLRAAQQACKPRSERLNGAQRDLPDESLHP